MYCSLSNGRLVLSVDRGRGLSGGWPYEVMLESCVGILNRCGKPDLKEVVGVNDCQRMLFQTGTGMINDVGIVTAIVWRQRLQNNENE